MRFLRIGTGKPPTELLTYLLCTEFYHCRPSQLAKERVVDVMPHLLVHAELDKARSKKK